MAWRGSISRTLVSTARRTSAFRTSTSIPPLYSAPGLHSRRFLNPRTLGCAQSMMPLFAGARLTPHLAVNVRALCELSHGAFRRSCQDR